MRHIGGGLAGSDMDVQEIQMTGKQAPGRQRSFEHRTIGITTTDRNEQRFHPCTPKR
jgi:hypothetical protein